STRSSVREESARSRLSSGGICASSCWRSEEHTSELQSLTNLVCRLLLEKKKKYKKTTKNKMKKKGKQMKEKIRIKKVRRRRVRVCRISVVLHECNVT